MHLVLALALQAGIPPPATPIARSNFDLARIIREVFDLIDPIGRRACAAAAARDPSTITVCARPKRDGYPVAQMDAVYGPRPLPAADVAIGGTARANVRVREGPTFQGQTSNRLMVGVRLPF